MKAFRHDSIVTLNTCREFLNSELLWPQLSFNLPMLQYKAVIYLSCGSLLSVA